ncbi:MAG: rod shape-determining protein MreD [Lactovum sp.]
MNRRVFQFLSPVILFCLMLIDGQVSTFFAEIFHYKLLPISHLLLIFLIYSVRKHSLNYLLILGLGLGIVYDSYYIGVIGIVAAILPLIFLFVHEIQETVFTNWWTKLFTVIIIIFLFEIAVYALQYAFHLISVNPLIFIAQQLSVTLVLNITLMLILEKILREIYKNKN